MARYPGRSSTRGSSSRLHRRRNPSTTSSSSTSNPRIGSPSNVSGSPSASRSTGTTTPAAATDPVGIAVIAPPADASTSTNSLASAPCWLRRGHRDRRAHDDRGDRERPHGRPVPRRPTSRITPRHDGADDGSDESADDRRHDRLAHRRRGSRAAEHRSGRDGEAETDGDDDRRAERPDRGGDAEPGCGRFASGAGMWTTLVVHPRAPSERSPDARRESPRRNRRSVISCGGNGRPKASGPRR